MIAIIVIIITATNYKFNKLYILNINSMQVYIPVSSMRINHKKSKLSAI